MILLTIYIKSIIFGNYFFERSITLHEIKKIIDSLIDDSPQAMKHIFDMFYKPLCFYAVRYVNNMPVAEEIVSDVMYKIWQNRHHGYRAESFREYMYTATRNTALNHIKQQQNKKKFSDIWVEELRNELIEETPSDKMIAEETQSKLYSLIDALPEQCRKAFVMSRLEDFTYDEIATHMGISTNTVKYHIKAALQKLRSGMEGVLVLLIFLWINILPYTPTLFPFSVVFIVLSVIP